MLPSPVKSDQHGGVRTKAPPGVKVLPDIPKVCHALPTAVCVNE